MRLPTYLGRRLVKPDAIVLWVDAPKDDQDYSVWLDVEGWALSMSGFALDIELFVNGDKLAGIEASGPSPEQALSFPRLPLAAACCFSHRIPRDRLPDSETSVLEIVARPRGGDAEWTALQRVARRIHRCAILTPPHSRQDYGAVWDAASTTPIAARRSVAGYADPAEYTRSGKTTADDVARELQVDPTDVVLEIGCGTGRIGLHLAPRCRRWIGSDVSASMLDHARATLDGHANVSFTRLNGFDLAGVADASVDVVYCSAVFMHLEEWDRYRYMTESLRVLRPGGRAWFDNMNLLSKEGWDTFVELSRIDPAGRPPNISKTSTPQELEAYAKHAGFTDIRLREGGIFVSVFGRKPS